MNWQDLLIDEDISITKALEKLDITQKKILFVSKGQRLLATLTDGDIRRSILKTGKIEGFVKDVANYEPKFLKEDELYKTKEFFNEYKITAIPIVNNSFLIVNVIFNDDTFLVNSSENFDVPVIINAGGKGTRLYPLTKVLPKPLIPIGNLPISEMIINRFVSCGCKNIFMIVNEKKSMIKAYYNDVKKRYNLTFLDEDIPLGTGGGLSLLKGKINGTSIFINCDTIIDDDYFKILKSHKESKNLITVICATRSFSIPFGVVNVSENGTIASMSEKPAYSFLVNTGCYVIEQKVIDELNDNEKIDFPDIIKKYLAKEKIGVYPIGYTSWLDMGQFNELERMKEILKIEN